jgi:hypothetical protein
MAELKAVVRSPQELDTKLGRDVAEQRASASPAAAWAHVGAAAGPPDPRDVLTLQGATGNRAVLHRVQARLRVGPVNDTHEQEADRVADQVMRAPIRRSDPWAPGNVGSLAAKIQRRGDGHGGGCGCPRCAVRRHAGHDHDDETIHRKALGSAVQRHAGHDDEETIHRKADIAAVQRHAGHDHDDDETIHRKADIAAVQRHAGHDHDDDDVIHRKSDVTAIQRDAHPAGCTCHDCAGVQRKAAGDGSFEADGDLSARIQRLSGGGAPLPALVRAEMEQRFGADFGGVRIHTDAESARMNHDLRAHAFTHGQDIAFAPGKYDPGSSGGKWLLAHELTHTIQQTGARVLQRSSHAAGCCCQGCAPVQRRAALAEVPRIDRSGPTERGVVQRHSTHEHYLLGTLEPDQIAALPKIRQAPRQDEEQRREAIHLLTSEMKRLARWKDYSVDAQFQDQNMKPEQDKRLGELSWIPAHKEKGLDDDVIQVDNHFEIPIVRIPTKHGSVTCTYGELNTLADMYGSIEDLAKADPLVVLRMIQGVRQRSFLQLKVILNEILQPEDATSDAVKERLAAVTFESDEFADAIGFKYINATLRQKIGALQDYEAQTKVDDEFTPSNASAALARNACHFAPEVWYTWRRYHEQARKLALEAYATKRKADEFDLNDDDEQRDALMAEHRTLANEALLHSGFGDHYLQDAYAAGHLIDKTAVMRWFVEWLPSNADKLKDKVPNQGSYPMIRAVARQDLESNPQMIENIQGGLEEKLDELNIKPEPYVELLMWWRRAARDVDGFKHITPEWALKATEGILPPRSLSAITKQLDTLAELGFAEYDKKKKTYNLHSYHISAIDSSVKAKDRIYASVHSDDKEPNFGKEAQEFYYIAYNKFLNRTYIQTITNVLHDKFCEEGLVVATKGRQTIGKIYGDNTMLKAGADDGVRHSATTAKWAREAIFNLITVGKADKTTDQIDERFPRTITPDWGDSLQFPAMDITKWWAQLELMCKKFGLFAQATSGINAANLKETAMKRLKQRIDDNENIMTPVEAIDDVFDEMASEYELKPPSHDVF